MLSASVLGKASASNRSGKSGMKYGAGVFILFLCIIWCFPLRSVGAANSQNATNANKSLALSASEKGPWSRIVMIGASASAGFYESEPFGGPTTSKLRLNRYLDAALQTSHEPVRNFSSAMFFMQPEGQGQSQSERALQSKPSLVVGLDFLFWFCYGDGPTD